MAIIIGAGMRVGAGMAISSGNPIRSEPITPPPAEEFDFQGDLQSLSGSVIDLMTLTGVEDLNSSLEGDLYSQTGTEDLVSGSGTVDLML